MNDTTKTKVLITGINGFVGSHLAEACAARGWAVYGAMRSFRSNLRHLPAGAYSLLSCDITDYLAVAETIRRVRPKYLFHLAAQSYVPVSWSAPRATLEINILGTMNILEAVRKENPDTVIQVAGSSEEYGMVLPAECPITEEQPLRPLSPYGASKAAADLLARQYAASYSTRVVVTRAFNHTGPRRGHVFAESDWARQIAICEAQKAPIRIRHGNLDAIRDYTDVRDIVKGYIAAVEGGKSGDVYNLCSGDAQSPTMREVLKHLAALSGAHVELVPEPSRLRPSDVPRLIGNGDKARRGLSWKPEIPLGVTLLDLLNYWRKQGGVEKEISQTVTCV